MAGKSTKTVSETEQLIELLSENLDTLSEEELLAECAEDFGSVDVMVKMFDAAVTKATAQAKRARLEAARQGYRNAVEQSQQTHGNNVLQLPLKEKRNLLDRLATMVPGQLTLAARNDNDSESDIDAMLRDLIELGAIDEEGNPKNDA